MDQLTVANLALMEIGDKGKVIKSFTDNSPEARAVSLYYSQTVMAMLRRYAWIFALQTVPMQMLRRRQAVYDPNTSPPGNWQFAYVTPSDMLKPVRVLTPDACNCTNPGMLRREKFRLGRLNGTGVVLTNADSAQITYTSLTAAGDESSWDSMFVQAVVFSLAARISMPITGSAEPMKVATQNLANLIKDVPPDVIEDTRFEDQMRALDYQENVDPREHVPQFLPDFQPAALRARNSGYCHEHFNPSGELPDPDIIPDGAMWLP